MTGRGAGTHAKLELAVVQMVVLLLVQVAVAGHLGATDDPVPGDRCDEIVVSVHGVAKIISCQ